MFKYKVGLGIHSLPLTDVQVVAGPLLKNGDGETEWE